MASSQAADQPPWHEAFPKPVITAPTVSRTEVLEWIRERRTQGADTKVDYVLVDLRRADHEVRFCFIDISQVASRIWSARADRQEDLSVRRHV
jgi:hypothetical protein